MKRLSRQNIIEAFKALSAELGPEEGPHELLIAGGAALVLLYDARAATKDVDAVTLSTICGRANMELRELTESLMNFDALAARQWVADAMREPIRWSEISRPEGLSAEALAVAAGVAEMLAERMGQLPPDWTRKVTQSPTKMYLVRAAQSMPRLRRLCEEEGPEPLRRRRILAPPEFLTVA